jgi:hypothetical protein
MLSWKWFLLLAAAAVGVGAMLTSGCGAEAASGRNLTSLPEGCGLSARRPGDVGIEGDPAVLFAENFEAGEMDDLAGRWEDVKGLAEGVLAFSRDVPPASSGKRSLQVTATLGANDGGHMYTRLPRPVDQVFVRFYVKFPAEAEYIHHFVHLGGYYPPTPYPQGGAGTRPRGDERVTVGIEPYGRYGEYRAPGIWHFYCYWQDMKISADDKYWGNGLAPAAPQVVPRGRWQCVEVMLKLNSAPEEADGELALWLDGKLAGHFAKGVARSRWTGEGFQLVDNGGESFEGFRWRNSTDLKINFFWLLHYVTEGALRQNRVEQPHPVNRVWFDDIVVSTQYIGPIKR